MHPLLVAAADLLLGASCAGCGQAAWDLCDPCRAELAAGAPEWVARPGLDIPVLAAGDYRPLLEKVVPRFKDDGALHLARVLGERAATAVATFGPPPETLLVPLPSLPVAIRRRGFDHAAALVRAGARASGMAWARLLRRRPTGRDQRELGRVGRSLNVAGSMRSRGCERPVLLVDDVVTTGASLAEAVRALRVAGVEVVGAVALGVADRRPARDVSLPPTARPRE